MILELRTSKDPKLNRTQLMQIPLKVIKQNAKHLKFQRKYKTKRLKEKPITNYFIIIISLSTLDVKTLGSKT